MYAEAAEAFGKSVSLDGSIGTTWVMLGLCEFQLGRADDALAHIQRGRELGTTPDPQFRQVTPYYQGLLLLGKSEFERAQETLAQLGADRAEIEDLVIALGLAVLRVRPSEPPGANHHSHSSSAAQASRTPRGSKGTTRRYTRTSV